MILSKLSCKTFCKESDLAIEIIKDKMYNCQTLHVKFYSFGAKHTFNKNPLN